MMHHVRIWSLVLIVGFVWSTAAARADDLVPIGLASQDITPGYPVRLTGYSSRQNESEGVEQRLFAKALAIGTDADLAVLITFDALGIAADQTEEIAAQLHKRFGLKRDRLAICASHTHTGPYIRGVGTLIFDPPLPEAHRAHSEQYRRELTDNLARVAASAIERRRLGTLSWARGEVKFAVNRRVLKDGKWTGFGVVSEGPVDHTLSVLAVHHAGKLSGVLVNYACHCTTLGPRFNRICGDWAGYAQEQLETEHPGIVGMVAIGCGADANPEPRDKGDAVELCRQHGAAVANEVRRLLTGEWLSLSSPLTCAAEQLELPFAPLPTREEYERRTQQRGPIAWHARTQLERLDRGEKLPTTLPYRVQVWKFGPQLTLVFLAGEVVVDYAMRLQRELPDQRLWMTAYANDCPCYIASKRVLVEGGYEADNSMYYYDRPTRFAPEVEDLIVAAVKRLAK